MGCGASSPVAPEPVEVSSSKGGQPPIQAPGEAALQTPASPAAKPGPGALSAGKEAPLTVVIQANCTSAAFTDAALTAMPTSGNLVEAAPPSAAAADDCTPTASGDVADPDVRLAVERELGQTVHEGVIGLEMPGSEAADIKTAMTSEEASAEMVAVAAPAQQEPASMEALAVLKQEVEPEQGAVPEAEPEQGAVPKAEAEQGAVPKAEAMPEAQE